jgi:hypothetical protein
LLYILVINSKGRAVFSFIKWLEENFNKLKRNKGLWFTTITTLSIVGIFTAMYYLNTMTDRASESVYSKAREDFLASLENKIATKNNFLISNAAILASYPLINSTLRTKNPKAMKQLSDYIQNVQEKLLSLNGIEVAIALYDQNLTQVSQVNFDPLTEMRIGVKDRFGINLAQKEKVPIVGIEKEGNYVYSRAFAPILLADGTVNGMIEFSQKIRVFQPIMENESKEYLFLLNKTELIDVSLRTSEIFSEIGDDFAAYEGVYNEYFYSNLTTVDFDLLFDQGYFIDENFYTTYKFVEDIEGQVIGVMIFGENTKTSSSVVNLTEDITRSVTTIALALVVSLVILLF